MHAWKMLQKATDVSKVEEPSGKGLRLLVDPSCKSFKKSGQSYSPYSSYSSGDTDLSFSSSYSSFSSIYNSVDKTEDSPYLTLNGAHFEHVTELDVSDNGITSLEITSLGALRSLTCSNNAIVTISLHGATLQSLVADNNRISSIRVKNHPRNLKHFTFSKNCIGSVPPWLVSCSLLRHLDVSHNNLVSLPAYVTSGHLAYLKHLAANHNQLEALSSSDNIPESSMTANERQRRSNLECLLLHHNNIVALSSNFFFNFFKLRVLNISSNKLEELPESSSSSKVEVCPYLEELFAANNKIRDLIPLEICQGLRVLHVPYNKISVFPESLTWTCELLEDIVLSGNFLTAIPSGLSRLPRLSVLKVHLNPIRSLPRLSHLQALKVIDASHCRLGRIEFESVVSASLSTLDISSNPSMKIDRKQFSKCRSRRAVSMVNTATDKARSLPLQDDTVPPTEESDAGGSSSDSSRRNGFSRQGTQKKNSSPRLPWSIGFCESSGREQSLTVGQLRVPDFEEGGAIGLVAMADGGSSFEIANRLLALFPKTLREEKLCCPDLADALKYSLLSCLRKLILQNGILPEAFCSAYFELEGKKPDDFHSRRSVRNPHADRIGSSLRLCCFGEIKAVVTSVDGPPLVVSSPSHKKNEEVKDKSQNKNRLKNPSTLPNPHTTLVRLGHHHRSLVIGSASLWESIQPDEVNTVCQNFHDPSLVAKRLLTLAQSYGSKKALSVLVTFLPTGTLRNSYQYSSLSAKNMNYSPTENTTSKNSAFKNRVQKNNSFHFSSQFPLGIQNKRLHQMEELERVRYPPIGQSDPEDLPKRIERSTSSPAGGESMTDLYATVQKPKSQPIQYYHYPSKCFPAKQPTNPDQLDPNEEIYEQIPPPIGFADSDDESSGSDSGFSGHSDSKMTNSKAPSSTGQVSEEQFKSWEFLLAKNTKVIFQRELDNLKGKKSQGSISSASVPNLSLISDDDLKESSLNELHPVHSTTSHFQRNVIRKSRFARGAVKLLQNKLNINSALKINDSFQKIRSKSHDSFRRFGSLQNLRQYQNPNLPSQSSVYVHPGSSKETDEEVNIEMKEKFDTLELESRMQHYWCNGTGVTCF